MNRSERDPASFDDAQVERLLEHFFAHEMPPELAGANTQSAATRAGERAARGGDVKKSASWTMPALAALTLGLSACMLWIAATRHAGPGTAAPGDHREDYGTEWGFGAAAPVNSPAAAIPYSFSQNVKPVESLRYDTLHGIVEQRTNLNTTSVSFIEPETGDLLELTMPELVIEIFPIDDRLPAQLPGAGSGHALPSDSPAAKLPEEG
jgi:hypothetical protein